MILLLLVIASVGVQADKSPFVKLDALDKNVVTSLQNEYAKEIGCLKRIDEHLKTQWSEELAKISTADLGDIEKAYKGLSSMVPKYDTLEQEWLMEGGSPAKQIDSCFRKLVVKVVPRMNRNEINCVNGMFASHLRDEKIYERIYKDYVRDASKEQIPFRRIFNFAEFVELLFQNRNPDAMTPVERTLYEHAESFLVNDADKAEHIWTTEQECEWQNARALREAATEEAKFNEFVTQVRHSVNRQLGSDLTTRWTLNMTLSNEKYEKWLKAREGMISKLANKVQELKAQKRDAQWLCEHATTLAYTFSEEQAAILLGTDDYANDYVDLEVSEIASRAWTFAKALETKKDFRQPAMQKLADEYDEGSRCLSSFLHLVQNHKRYEAALDFVDGLYTFPELFCKRKSLNLGLISTRLCNCIGSFCVSHGLAAVFVEEYELVQEPDGTYKVVRSGKTSREKVTAWNND